MSDLAVLALAAAVWIGSLVAAPVPRGVALALTAAALLSRRTALVVVAGALLAASLGAAAWRGLDPPRDDARIRASVVLISDPERVGRAVRADLRLGRRHVEAWARGAPAAALEDRLAGEVVRVDGRLQGVGSARDRLAVRHVAARLDVTSVDSWRPGAPLTRLANAIRRTLAAGASSMPSQRRALLSGFLLGDTRDLDPATESDFRAAGLTHLLAVSGQNLAFLMAAAGPALRRLRLRARLVASLAVIGLFAVMTRAEPSVLRASAMASIACWSAFAGVPVARLRVLALAVTALVLVDPLLSRSVGFQLSVGASLGLATLAAPLARRLRGPRWLAEALAVTIAAQAGVAPVLLTTFGGMPIVTPLANLLAVPIAGPLTAWGMSAGLLAGLLGGPLAALLQVPTNVMVAWIDGVARAGARMPLGLLDGRGIVVGIAVAGLALWWRRLAIPVGVVALLLVARPAHGAARDVEVARGVHLWRAGAVVLVVDGPADAARTLDGLRRAGVGTIDLVVARRGSKDIGGLLADLRARHAVRAIAAPAGNQIRDATPIDTERTITVGRLRVHLVPQGAILDVDR